MKNKQILHVRTISYTYSGSAEPAILHLSCSVESGQLICLTGESASGKSTFGRLLKGFHVPQSGAFSLASSIGSQPLLNDKDRMKLVGWTGAHPEIQLFAETVRSEIEFGPVNLGLKGDELSERVNWAMGVVGLDAAEFSERHPLSLSGGERRRVALASVISMNFPFYVFDEPTAGLDWRGRQNFTSAIQSLLKQNCGVIWITHDDALLKELEYDLWELVEGRLN